MTEKILSFGVMNLLRKKKKRRVVVCVNGVPGVGKHVLLDRLQENLSKVAQLSVVVVGHVDVGGNDMWEENHPFAMRYIIESQRLRSFEKVLHAKDADLPDVLLVSNAPVLKLYMHGDDAMEKTLDAEVKVCAEIDQRRIADDLKERADEIELAMRDRFDAVGHLFVQAFEESVIGKELAEGNASVRQGAILMNIYRWSERIKKFVGTYGEGVATLGEMWTLERKKTTPREVIEYATIEALKGDVWGRWRERNVIVETKVTEATAKARKFVDYLMET